jgi:hypothetical protein
MGFRAGSGTLGMEADGQRENPVIPRNENYGVVKLTPSIDELSINLDLASFQHTWSVYCQYTCTEKLIHH